MAKPFDNVVGNCVDAVGTGVDDKDSEESGAKTPRNPSSLELEDAQKNKLIGIGVIQDPLETTPPQSQGPPRTASQAAKIPFTHDNVEVDGRKRLKMTSKAIDTVSSKSRRPETNNAR
ncbi:thioredoxin-like 3-2 chloroplastic [Phtheirospermum japonicum]|uniref:Thioredoxin-like 3-2 chloroplastic n=1 Tax=Phtheirospermum japonicum TaxID=374723 RepID=A0A830BV69_9LAMI|nr:thioredoxin-like 3-2 chloroplastic [Phtheirospermum japonicum]